MVSTRWMSSSSGAASSNNASSININNSTAIGGGSSSLTLDPIASTSRCTRSNIYFLPPSSHETATSTAPFVTQTIFLLDLPQEVIEKILSYLTFKNVSQLRLVSRRMDQICGSLLNSTFQKLQVQMLQRFQSIKAKMPRRESARRNHPLATESDIIETLHMRLSLLQMTFGKHIERKHCCFFAGEVLDEVYRVLHYIKITVKLPRPYKVTDELFDLSSMAMEYFKEKIEPKLPDIGYFGTDFLDLSMAYQSNNKDYLRLDTLVTVNDSIKLTDDESCLRNDIEDNNYQKDPLPQSNMVLRKRIKRIKQGMKKYNNQLTVLQQDLRKCKRKTNDQQKEIAEQKRQLVEQQRINAELQKQTLEYATRFDEVDKKNEEMSRKFSTMLQELNKCKTELQYWRSKSPAEPPKCQDCGAIFAPVPQEDLEVLVNQGVRPEGLGIVPTEELETDELNKQDNIMNTNDELASEKKDNIEKEFKIPKSPPLSPSTSIAMETIGTTSSCSGSKSTTITKGQTLNNNVKSIIIDSTIMKSGSKRKFSAATTTSLHETSDCESLVDNSKTSECSSLKKIRRTSAALQSTKENSTLKSGRCKRNATKS